MFKSFSKALKYVYPWVNIFRFIIFQLGCKKCHPIVYTKHRADDSQRSSNYPHVTLIYDSVEEIVDMVSKKRKYANNFHRSDVKRLKSKLYD